MVVTLSLDVLASSVQPMDLVVDARPAGSLCRASDDKIVGAMQYIRANEDDVNATVQASDAGYIEQRYDDLWLDIFSFDVLFMDSLLFGMGKETGYIVVVYDDFALAVARRVVCQRCRGS